VGSIEELRRLSGRTDITDLHRDYIDDVTIPSSTPGAPPLRRVCEVFDCWFESGSMPYAQAHFPFENEANFRRHFPAEFIAEGDILLKVHCLYNWQALIKRVVGSTRYSCCRHYCSTSRHLRI
jgi:hypothetical protein